MMMFVLPAFKEVYANMGAELPSLTQLVMNLSDLFVDYGWIMIILLIVSAFGLYKLHMKNRPTFQKRIDALILRLPVFGTIVRKATIARWAVRLPPLRSRRSFGGSIRFSCRRIRQYSL